MESTFKSVESDRFRAGARKDMEERAKEVEADNARTRAYYKKFADAEAAKWQNSKVPAPDSMTVHSDGSWSKTYNAH